LCVCLCWCMCAYAREYSCVCLCFKKLQVSFAEEPYKRDNIHVSIRACVCVSEVSCASCCDITYIVTYGVATISRLLRIIGLFCRISSLS